MAGLARPARKLEPLAKLC